MLTSLSQIIERADELYVARSDIENVRTSIKLLQEAETGNDYEASWRLGRAHFFLGQEAQSVNEKRSQYKQGASASSRAVRLRAERVEGHFWLGVNLALLAQSENSLHALFHALRAKKALERAAQLDAAYHAAGPLRVLARLQHKLPRLLGGDSKHARANFQKAMSLAPASTVTRIYFAEMLMETGDETEARTQLESIIHTPPDPLWIFETERDRRLAQKLLTGMDRIRQDKEK